VGRSAIPGPTKNPRLSVTQHHGKGALIESTTVARATLCTDQGKKISLVAGTSQRLYRCDWDLSQQALTLEKKKAPWVKCKKLQYWEVEIFPGK
jgi:hypothetical protein